MKIDQETILERHQGFYKKLVNLENQELDAAMERDGLHRAGILKESDTSDFVLPDKHRIKRILRAYGNLDPEVGY